MSILSIYACDACKFLFHSDSRAERCPDCGKFQVRPANEEEIREFESRKYLDFDNWGKESEGMEL